MDAKLNFIKADNIMSGTGDIDIYHISKLDDGKLTIAGISSPITPFWGAGCAIVFSIALILAQSSV